MKLASILRTYVHVTIYILILFLYVNFFIVLPLYKIFLGASAA